MEFHHKINGEEQPTKSIMMVFTTELLKENVHLVDIDSDYQFC